VLSAAVFGLPDEVRGQEVAAAVVLKPGAEASGTELSRFVKERIAAYKFPRIVHLVPELPLGPSGKVLKRELVRRYSAPDGGAAEPDGEAVGQPAETLRLPR
jgi:long-chain acyl-CoA synthetase